MKYSKQLLLTFILFSSFSLQAQQTISTTGGDATGSGGTVHYTIGQIASSTNSSSNFSEAQGVQQPFEISIITSTTTPSKALINAQLFPNPTTNQLTLKIEDIQTDQMSYELYDLLGRLLQSEIINSTQTQIAVKNFPPAIYVLRIVQNQQTLTRFKIIKN